MILIAGDSWSCGEWPADSSNLHLDLVGNKQYPHGGLSQYLEEDGYEVLNVGRPGSNADVLNIINTAVAVLNHVGKPVDKIFIFTTEWVRNFYMGGVDHFTNESDTNQLFSKLGYFIKPGTNFFDQFNITGPQQLETMLVTQYYNQLSAFSQKTNIPIYLLGGAADVASYVDSPGVTVACQSITNLLVTGNHQLDRPVFTFYSMERKRFVEWYKKQFPNKIEEIIEIVDRGDARLNVFRGYPDFFQPDGSHPNRKGHKVLFDFLKSQGYFD